MPQPEPPRRTPITPEPAAPQTVPSPCPHEAREQIALGATVACRLCQPGPDGYSLDDDIPGVAPV